MSKNQINPWIPVDQLISEAVEQGFKNALQEMYRTEQLNKMPIEKCRWIPVKMLDGVQLISGTLPDVDGEYLVTRENCFGAKSVSILHFCTDTTTRYPYGFSLVKDSFSWRKKDVVAWMPLPEPYREDGESE